MIEETDFLTFDQILDLHHESLAAYGGLDGIRDEGLLRSAIDQPKNDFFYGQADEFGVAAAYAFHIAQPRRFSTATNEPQSPPH